MDELLLPVQWQEWTIEEQIGSGSYGTVFRAVGADGKECAIKIIEIPGDSSELENVMREYPDEQSARNYYSNLVQELVREIDTMNALKGSANIVSFEDFLIEENPDEIGWTIYIRMEYLQSFPEYQMEQDLDEKETIRFAMDICSALEQCKKMRIIHRDIKPANVLVAPDGTYKLCDFGIARHIDQSMGSMSLKGTYTYMAPEIYHGEKYGSRVDIYSLGIMLYRMMNHNRDPFISLEKQMVYYRDREEALNLRMDGEELPLPADASPEFAEIICRACAYEAENRYADGTEMKNDLQLLLGGRYCLRGVQTGKKSAEKATDKPLESAKKAAENLSENAQIEQGMNAKQNLSKHGRRTGLIITLVLSLLLGAGGTAVWMNLSQKKAADTLQNEIQNENGSQMQLVAYGSYDNLSGAASNEETEAALREFDAVLWEILRNADYDSFALLMDQYYQGEVPKEDLFAGLIQIYYMDGMDQNINVYPIYQDEISEWWEVTRYQVRITGEAPNDRASLESTSMQYRIGYDEEENLLLLGIGEDVSSELAMRIDPTLWTVLQKGGNAAFFNNYMWMDSHEVYEGIVDLAVQAAWQNEDGSVDFLLNIKNGKEEEQIVSELNFSIEDVELGIIIDMYGQKCNLTVPAKTSTIYRVHVEAENVLTGTQPWTYVHYETRNQNDTK